MFRNCYSLESIDLSNLNTSNVQTMVGMFENCGKLTSLNLSNFDTRKIRYMNSVFNNCTSLSSLIINFNTTYVQRMNYIFGSCTSLKTLNLTSFRTDKMSVSDLSHMFENDYGLIIYINEKMCKNLIPILPEYVTYNP